MESEFKKDLNPAPKSKPARLCITVDKFFKPVHIKIISNELRDYNRYCRNEAADALLHQTPDILQRRVVSFEFPGPENDSADFTGQQRFLSKADTRNV